MPHLDVSLVNRDLNGSWFDSTIGSMRVKPLACRSSQPRSLSAVVLDFGDRRIRSPATGRHLASHGDWRAPCDLRLDRRPWTSRVGFVWADARRLESGPAGDARLPSCPVVTNPASSAHTAGELEPQVADRSGSGPTNGKRRVAARRERPGPCRLLPSRVPRALERCRVRSLAARDDIGDAQILSASQRPSVERTDPGRANAAPGQLMGPRVESKR